MDWTAIVPLKRNAHTKSRLADCLTVDERFELADLMVANVIDALQRTSCISEIIILSPVNRYDVGTLWEADLGFGLNGELQRCLSQKEDRPVLVVHGDLPLLTSQDIQYLCDRAAKNDGAIAPDRHARGTNAIAIMPHQPIRFRFGAGSFSAHLEQLGGLDPVVATPGLAHDIDRIDDYETLMLEHGDMATAVVTNAVSQIFSRSVTYLRSPSSFV